MPSRASARCTILALILLAAVISSACQGHARFEVSSLNIEPSEALAGSEVAVTAEVTNSGSAEGMYTVVVSIDDEQVGTREVRLSPGATKKVSFRVMRDAPGTYNVQVDGLTATLTVLAASPESIVAGIAAKVEQLRGLSPRAESAWRFLRSEELNARMEQELREEVSPEEVAVDREVLATLDLLDEDYDLYHELLELYQEQVAGFYDSEADELYVLGAVEEIGPVERLAFAHEYTHLLQDQHFDLESLPLAEEGDSDRAIAALALAEGDATYIELQYAQQNIGFLELLGAVSTLETEKLESAPRVVRENLMFPYEAGLNFVAALLQKGGWQAVNRAFGDPPQSTEQVIHPDKYLHRDEPQEIVMPDLGAVLGGTWAQQDSDVLGELNLRIYLEAFVDSTTASAATAGWDGDRYLFFKDATGRRLLVLRSTWDTEQDAEEFFNAYLSFVANKSGNTWSPLKDDQWRKWWRTSGLSCYLSQRQNDVLLVIAPDEASVEVVLALFSPF